MVERVGNFGEWNAAGQLFLVTIAAYLFIVLVCFLWERINICTGRLYRSDKADDWVVLTHPARSFYGRILGFAHVVVGMIQVGLYAWRTSTFEFDVVSDAFSVFTVAYFSCEFVFRLCLAAPRGKVAFMLGWYQLCNVVSGTACDALSVE